MPEKFSKTLKSVILPGGKEVLNEKTVSEEESRDKSSDS
jgi:hypothetical protein